MAKPAYDPATGKPVYSPDSGKPAMDCGAFAAWKLVPCVEVDNTCNLCPSNETPKFLTMTITGAVTCPDCISNGANGFDNFVISLNGSYLVPRFFDCSWRNASFGSWSYDKWANTDCTGAMTAHNGTWEMFVQKINATEWSLDGINSNVTATFLSLFFANKTGDASCDNIPEFASLLNCEKALESPAISPVESGMKVNFAAGDLITPGIRCPGGETYFTNTDMTPYDGKVVEIDEDPGICYRVSPNVAEEIATDTATVSDGGAACWTTCAKCCAEDAGDC